MASDRTWLSDLGFYSDYTVFRVDLSSIYVLMIMFRSFDICSLTLALNRADDYLKMWGYDMEKIDTIAAQA